VRDPDGHRCELLLPAIQLIDIDEEPQRYTIAPDRNNNRWGLPAPQSWVEEAILFAGVEVKQPAVEGNPFTLERYLQAKAARAPTRHVA
jgi:hypothetical protein